MMHPRPRPTVMQTVAQTGRFARLRVAMQTATHQSVSDRPGATPPVADLLIALVTAGWVAAAIYTAAHMSPSLFLRLIPLIVVTALVRRMNIGLYASETFIGLSVVGNLAAGMMYGAPGAVTCSSICILAGMSPRRMRQRLRSLLFNTGALSLSNGLAAIVFIAVDQALPFDGRIAQVPGALLAACVTYLSESLFVALIIAFTQGRSPSRVWSENFQWLLPYWMMFGVVALGLVESYSRSGILGLLIFAGPALLMRYTMKQYMDRTARSVKELSTRNTELEHANREIAGMSATLQETYLGTLEALVAALDARDRETYGHSTRVAQLTATLAREWGIPEGTPEFLDIERGALLHDVGKIGVADAILRKPGKLTDAEWVDMRQHARIGFDVLKDVPFLAGAAKIVAAHHERWDGKGYPNGLAGDDIPIGARMFMLADTFDAMCTDRPYRRARTYEESLEELVRCSGTQFQPEMVEIVQRLFPLWVEIHKAGLQRAAERELNQVA